MAEFAASFIRPTEIGELSIIAAPLNPSFKKKLESSKKKNSVRRKRSEGEFSKSSSSRKPSSASSRKPSSASARKPSSSSFNGSSAVLGVYDIGKLLLGRVYNKLISEDPDKVDSEEENFYEFSLLQIEEFRKVFHAFDRDGNGTISTAELGPVLRALGYTTSEPAIEKVSARFDADHSGDLSFAEYLELMAVWVEEDETQIMEAFKVFDKSGDGYATISEIKRAMCKFGDKFSEEEADEIFDMIDVEKGNTDGKINYDTFVRYLLADING